MQKTVETINKIENLAWKSRAGNLVAYCQELAGRIHKSGKMETDDYDDLIRTIQEGLFWAARSQKAGLKEALELAQGIALKKG